VKDAWARIAAGGGEEGCIRKDYLGILGFRAWKRVAISLLACIRRGGLAGVGTLIPGKAFEETFDQLEKERVIPKSR
jgi:hypothetical protein